MSDPNNPEIITVNAERILKGDLSQNISLLDGDIIIVPQAHMYGLSDLLTEISPLLNFGGLITTGPMVTLAGYNWNVPGASQQIRDFATEQRLIQQVQQNLTRSRATETQ
jgi:hypothetical protein